MYHNAMFLWWYSKKWGNVRPALDKLSEKEGSWRASSQTGVAISPFLAQRTMIALLDLPVLSLAMVFSARYDQRLSEKLGDRHTGIAAGPR